MSSHTEEQDKEEEEEEEVGHKRKEGRKERCYRVIPTSNILK